MNFVFRLVILAAFFLSLASATHANEAPSEDNLSPRLSTDEVENQIQMDRQANPLYESRLLAPIHAWKNEVAEKTGMPKCLQHALAG